ncbi:SMP-30/gluconolactonase/LRE family protein [Limnohabitans sp. Rim8]|uniref:SMP-30/gluconolactonase/LRE family protein n=1 Tax=Limnohabitans sp. Rim8 TaxID=1100718 RepID=UPI0025FFA647|nr:SMP-30/gluconolactonase/LRE family protein [Limnohabitans sp. Rim8]
MQVLEARCILNVRNALGEGPLWHPVEQALYWLDCMSRELLRHVPGQEVVQRWTLRGTPGSFAFCSDGTLLIVYRNGLAFLDLATGSETPIAARGPDFGLERFNDGKCDSRGRFWVGTMDRELKATVGSLYRIGSDLLPYCADRGAFTLSNGIAWSPDECVLYACDSRPGRIFAYAFEPETGTLGERRVFIDYAGRSGRPDGCTIDAEGGLWVAEYDGARVSRYDSDGRCRQVIPLPIPRPTSVTFGGPGLATLFITSMRHGVDTQAHPDAGGVFAVKPGVCGLPASTFVL